MTYDVRRETIDKAAELVRAGKLNERFKATVYHGFRSKKSLKQIKEEGIEYYAKTYAEARMDADEALRHFGFSTKYSLDAWESPTSKWRWCIWATTYGPDVCGWAVRSPEATFLTLENAYLELPKTHPPKAEINKYRIERYGRPIASKLLLEIKAQSIFRNPCNINTERKRIKPSEILDLSFCEEAPIR